MVLAYTLYLLFTLVGAFALKQFFSISFSTKQKKAIVFSLIITTIIFALWDAWAVSQNHWQFGLGQMLGIQIGNQPLEEIGFFTIIPFFGIILWEIAGKMDILRKNNRAGVKKR